MPGMNDTPESSRKIATLAREIGPNRIHLNTAVHRGAKATVPSLSEKELSSLCNCFESGAEIIRDCPNLVLKPGPDSLGLP